MCIQLVIHRRGEEPFQGTLKPSALPVAPGVVFLATTSWGPGGTDPRRLLCVCCGRKLASSCVSVAGKQDFETGNLDRKGC